MYLGDLFIIVCLLTAINVSFGVIVSNKESELGSERRFVEIQTQSRNISKIEIYYHTKNVRKKCLNNPAKQCTFPVREKKERVIWKIVNETVPIYKCRDGYKMLGEFCLPICTNDCVNGVCISPEQCKCSVGYERDKNDSSKCNPVCDECEHGDCISPNYCMCSDGYQWNDGQTNKCIPICKTNCPNGKCIAPNQCTCNENYYFNATLDLCVPKCEPPCIFGECIAPNECKCIDNYQLEYGSSTNECKPICNPSCINGMCISSSVYHCNDDYQFKNESSKECDEHCKDGKYVVANKCKCLHGYQFKNGSVTVCEPICTELCVNGECIAFNQCECHVGYQFKIGSTYECEPICERECVNGQCTEPNVCECNDNYEKSSYQNATNICCPICEFGKDCANTNCIIGYCECAENLAVIIEDDRTLDEHLVDRNTDALTVEQSTVNLLNEMVSTEPTDDDRMSIDAEQPILGIFNWWPTIVAAFLIIAAIIFSAIWYYKNRKIDYQIDDDAQASVHYWKSP